MNFLPAGDTTHPHTQACPPNVTLIHHTPIHKLPPPPWRRMSPWYYTVTAPNTGIDIEYLSSEFRELEVRACTAAFKGRCTGGLRDRMHP